MSSTFYDNTVFRYDASLFLILVASEAAMFHKQLHEIGTYFLM